MFVVWQNAKPRVVTDHSALGLNAGIPAEEAKVHYNNMHNFRQIMCNVCRENPGRHLVIFKSDVASTFLNLPAHPMYMAAPSGCERRKQITYCMPICFWEPSCTSYLVYCLWATVLACCTKTRHLRFSCLYG